MSQQRIAAAGLVCWLALSLWATPVAAHQVWIEMATPGSPGQEQVAHICWGHSGQRVSGPMLESQKDRLTAWLASPESPTERLPLTLGADSYTARAVPRQPGYYTLGAETQGGIADREFHGIPAGTRIVMSGKTFLHVPGSEAGLERLVGMDLELVPVGDPKSWRTGGVVTVRVVFKGKPVGGKKAEVSLSTVGPKPLANDSRVEGLEWSVKNYADPRTGEVSFPLIVGGRHTFFLKYVDETPGRYDGDLTMTTKFSHLRKGDAYERTLYMGTLTVQVNAE
jgi:uncharacterized GH25 family protein